MEKSLLEKIATVTAERYNRRCRRIVALASAGRAIKDYDGTNVLRMTMEIAQANLANA